MKIVGRAADFCGAKEKREENETMISMGKKAKAFFFLRSFFLPLLLLSSRFSQKKRGPDATQGGCASSGVQTASFFSASNRPKGRILL